MMSVSFDPFTKLENVPQTPKQRYEIMTKEMPKDGKLSLHMTVSYTHLTLPTTPYV